MIYRITKYEDCREFVADFDHDPKFSDPMLTTEEQLRNNLIKSINQPERHCVLGVFKEERMIGLFAFLILQDEHYSEMLVGLSRDRSAYEEMFEYLEQNYPGYDVDFVFNPKNDLLKALLNSRKAEFEPEQQKMVLRTPILDVDTSSVELLSEKYVAQYCALHNKDMYWTGEKVASSSDRFRVFVAICDEQVIGYMDVTHCFEENEPFDLFVREEDRRKGYGRKLLAKALELNQPKGMMLLVETDNDPAIRLYVSMGFEKVLGQNNLTAHWKVAQSEK